MVLAVVVAVSVVMILAALLVVFKSVERTSDITLDLLLLLAAGRRGRRVDYRSIGIYKPLSDIDADGRVLRRLIDDERRIEFHFQL